MYKECIYKHRGIPSILEGETVFGEVGRGVPEYFSSSEKFFKNDVVKCYSEKTFLKHYSCNLVVYRFSGNVMTSITIMTKI